MKLSWGKPKIEVCQCVGGVPVGATWRQIDTPKEDTTNFSCSEGEKKEAKEEGGARRDVAYKTYDGELKYDIFVEKGKAFPFVENDGIVEGEIAVRITPEDPTCIGIQLDCTTVYVLPEYTSADGILLHITHSMLKPASGRMVKYHINGVFMDGTTNYISLSQHSLEFTLGSADTVTLTANTYPTNATVTWTSLDTNVAEVTSGGVVSASDETGKTTGTTVIIASFVEDGVVYTDVCTVTVVTSA